MRVVRSCLGASKLQHFLRLYCEALPPVLNAVDKCIDRALRRVVAGLTDEGRVQASLGEPVG
eukprot:11213586-Lingulodinium_polyedra.AAC.1